MYRIEYAEGVEDELAAIKPFVRRRIMDAADELLAHQPLTRTRNRKPLASPARVPASGPIWELRIGNYRVFYDVDESKSVATVRAVHQKPPHRTTEDIL
jgi:mRNA-degrading endonuclease RelE of RelBE toxin-antitoxin system